MKIEKAGKNPNEEKLNSFIILVNIIWMRLLGHVFFMGDKKLRTGIWWQMTEITWNTKAKMRGQY
jgi:hypothetical protein